MMEINYTIKNIREGAVPNTYYVDFSYEYDGLSGAGTVMIMQKNITKKYIIEETEYHVRKTVEGRIKSLSKVEQFTELQKSIIGKYTTNR